MKTVAIVANGVIHDYALMVSIIKDYDIVVAIDGGLCHLHKMSIVPDLIIGDLDSVPEEILNYYSQIPIKKFSREKDESDLELALKEFNHPAVHKITLFGALENRTDHALYNLFLIYEDQKIYIETEREIIFFISGEREIKCFPGHTMSLLSLWNNASGISSQGLKWELQTANPKKNLMSLSNISLGNTVKVSISKGSLLCIMQKKI